MSERERKKERKKENKEKKERKKIKKEKTKERQVEEFMYFFKRGFYSTLIKGFYIVELKHWTQNIIINFPHLII